MLNPIGAYATIKWLDEDTEVSGYYFSFGSYDEDKEDPDSGKDSNGVPDSMIFYYCDDENDLRSFMTKGKEDFIVLSYELEYKEMENA